MNTFEDIPAESDEWHIASLVVQSRVEDFASLHEYLNGLANTSVEASDKDTGKSIVVIEASSTQSLARTTDAIRTANYVIDAQLVYHQMVNNSTLEHDHSLG